MAANLLKADHVVTVYNRMPAKTETLIAQGAKAAGSIADVGVLHLVKDVRKMAGATLTRPFGFQFLINAHVVA